MVGGDAAEIGWPAAEGVEMGGGMAAVVGRDLPAVDVDMGGRMLGAG